VVNGMTQTRGIRHLALRVKNLRRSQVFYEGLFGMKVVWQPDGDNVYLSSGSDNLALHQIAASEQHEYDPPRGQFLDHFGFLMDSQESVDSLFQSVERHVGRYGGAVLYLWGMPASQSSVLSSQSWMLYEPGLGFIKE
jgi:catechol 2,3-dioxygenase-like lactoylglutathione lyase family enzyme